MKYGQLMHTHLLLECRSGERSDSRSNDNVHLLCDSLSLWALRHRQAPNTRKPDSKEPGFFTSAEK
ncbi:hypothetical protein CWB70_19735 [Pseudoalteromonas sp. S981]|nr:hypothetical protein CWB70_19735 [Pseudoalteromonas sp. S981]